MTYPCISGCPRIESEALLPTMPLVNCKCTRSATTSYGRGRDAAVWGRRSGLPLGSKVVVAGDIKCARRMTALGHFETKSDACHCASIGLILLQELTFGRSASKAGA